MRSGRICLLIFSVVLTAWAAFGPSMTVVRTGPAAAAPMVRPNIIFVLTDDLDAKSIAFMPKLKALFGDQGTTFVNFFVTDALCCPSRSSILRGQYVHNHRVLTNAAPNGGFQRFQSLGHESSTVAVWLRDAGYRTALMGKYLNGYPGRTGATYVPPGWDEWYSPAGGNAYRNYNYRLNENGRLVSYGNAPEDYLTDVLARKGADFIRRTSREGQPFFLYLATYAPHAPATPAPRHQNEFASVAAPRSPSFNEADVNGKPRWVRSRPLLTPRQIAQIDEAYRTRLRSLQAVDEMLAALINALQADGQLGRTYLFFTSDNGFHMGEHRLMPGKNTVYEEDLRVPMLVRGPGVPAGRTLPHLALNIDFAPTFAELAGASSPAWVDGRSLVPLLGNAPGGAPPASAWRQAFLAEHYVQTQPEDEADAAEAQRRAGPPQPAGGPERAGESQPARGPAVPAGQRPRGGAIPEAQALRAEDYAYMEYSTGERELYDLRADPYELRNLITTADQALLRQLAARLATLRLCAGAACRPAEDASVPALAGR